MGVSQMMKRVSCLMRHVKQLSTNTASVRVESVSETIIKPELSETIIKPELVSEKIIKPSSPTPENLRHYKLSYLDQLLDNQYIPMTLFYSNTSTAALSSSSLSSTLEKSFATLLSFYYPYGGKVVHNSFVDCNDEGAPFKEVRVRGSMSETLIKNFSTVQETLFPEHGLPWTEVSEDANLAVAQVTHFDCGGLAISLCLSHKLSDAYTICKMLNDWAEIARNSTSMINPPSLVGSSLLQPKDNHFPPSWYVWFNKEHPSVVRLKFNPMNIKRLKAIVSSESDVKDPTSFEVVAAMVNKCTTIASDSYNSLTGSYDPFSLYIPMNLRKLINPNVPYLFGNFMSSFLVDVSEDDGLKLPKLVSKIREEKIKHLEKYRGKNKDEILAGLAGEENRLPKHPNWRVTTSICTFPLYNIDFGWGRPIRVTAAALRTDNCFVLLDAPEKGGIDAIGALDQSNALKFKIDKDVLDFAEVDPSY